MDATSASAIIARNVLGALEAAGGDSVGLARDLAIPLPVDTDTRLPSTVIAELWRRAPIAANDDAFGLHAAERLKPGQWGLVEYWIASSPNAREALERFARYYRVLTEMMRMSVEVRGERASIVWESIGPTDLRHASEHFAAIVTLTMRRLLGTHGTPLEIAFTHERSPAADELRRVLGAPVRFGARAMRIDVARTLLELPLSTTDDELARALRPVVDAALARLPSEDDVVERARRELVDTLRSGAPEMRALARRLRTSSRTLQRVLATNGTSYKTLVDEVRRELAMGYLADGRMTLPDVAVLLGFSQQSALTRAFKRWTGGTPTAFRSTVPLSARDARDARRSSTGKREGITAYRRDR